MIDGGRASTCAELTARIAGRSHSGKHGATRKARIVPLRRTILSAIHLSGKEMDSERGAPPGVERL